MRVLPILPASATDDVIQQALKDRGIPKAVYDFIEHNLGKGAALVAILTAEPRGTASASVPAIISDTYIAL